MEEENGRRQWVAEMGAINDVDEADGEGVMKWCER